MPERRLLILESYTTTSPDREQWRLMNAPGLPFADDLRQYAFFEPVHCKPGVLDEITKVLSLLNSTLDAWKAVGVIIKGPKGEILKMDGDRYRRAIIEKVAGPAHICTTCGQRCHQSNGNAATLRSSVASSQSNQQQGQPPTPAYTMYPRP